MPSDTINAPAFLSLSSISSEVYAGPDGAVELHA